MNLADPQYLDVLEKLLVSGVRREGRNGTTFGLFGHHMRFNLAEGFPLLTTKRIHFRSVMVELLWFLRGGTNIKFLTDHGVTIWDEWADKNGELGPVYGKQWRSWQSSKFVPYSQNRQPPIDQIANVVEGLKRDPHGRRHIVTAWNPAEIDEMALPPCHLLFQFHVANGKLSCHLYQRSADWFLGVPFNIASYALLTHLVAQEVGLQVGDFVHSFGDLHLYENHLEAAQEQLSRRAEARELPVLVIPGNDHTLTPWPGLFNLDPSHIRVELYHPMPGIKAQVSK